MSPLLGQDLAPHDQLAVVGAANDPNEVNSADVIFGGRSIVDALTGMAIENEHNLRFSAPHALP